MQLDILNGDKTNRTSIYRDIKQARQTERTSVEVDTLKGYKADKTNRTPVEVVILKGYKAD